MNNEIGLLTNQYDGVLLGGVINPLFRMLDNSVIICKYAQEYIHIVYEKGSLIDENHLIIANQMITQIEIVADECLQKYSMIPTVSGFITESPKLPLMSISFICFKNFG